MPYLVGGFVRLTGYCKSAAAAVRHPGLFFVAMLDERRESRLREALLPRMAKRIRGMVKEILVSEGLSLVTRVETKAMPSDKPNRTDINVYRGSEFLVRVAVPVDEKQPLVVIYLDKTDKPLAERIADRVGNETIGSALEVRQGWTLY